MTCRRIKKMIPAVLDNDLRITQREWLRFQVHISGCAECKGEYLRYKQLYNAINGMQYIPEPDYQKLRLEIKKRIEDNEKESPEFGIWRYLRVPYTLRYALQFVILVFIVGGGLAVGTIYREKIINFYRNKIILRPAKSAMEKKAMETQMIVPELPSVPLEGVAERGGEAIESSQKIAKTPRRKEAGSEGRKPLSQRDVIDLKILQAKKSGEQLKICFNILKNGRLIEGPLRDNLSFAEFYPESGWVTNSSFELLPPGEKEPFYIALILDYSDSMTPNLDLVERGAREFVKNLTFNDRVMIIKFAEDVVIATDGFVKDRNLLYTAIDKRFMLRFSTSLYKAIDVGLNELKDKGENKLLIVLTDGDDTHSNAFEPPVTFDGVYKKARDMRIPLFILGIGKEIVEEKLSVLATGTSGLFIKAERPEDIVSIYRELGRTIVKTPCIIVDYSGERYSKVEKFKIAYQEGDLFTETTLIKKNREEDMK